MKRKSNIYMVLRDYGYWHPYHHPKLCRMCDSEAEIHKLSVTECPEDTAEHWAWWDNEKERFEHVYPTKSLVSMMFAYGHESEEELGHGILLPVKLEYIETVE